MAPGSKARYHRQVYIETNQDKVPEKYSIAMLQNCYNFFTLGLDLLTGKNAGDIINLNSGG